MTKLVAVGFFTVAVVGAGTAWAQVQRQRARPVPKYMSIEPFQSPYTVQRDVQQYTLPNGGPGSRPYGSYVRGGEGSGSP